MDVPTHDAEIDALELLGDAVDRFQHGLRAHRDPTPYVAGQLAYLNALAKAIAGAAPDATPADVLAATADGFGLKLVDGSLARMPADEGETGALAAWALCLGYVEGLGHGVEAAMDAIEGVADATVEFERR